MSTRVFNVLFLCTGKSARSILAESILQRDGAGTFRAFSAGSQPKGEVNPWSLRVLRSMGYPHEGFRSKSWDEFSGSDAPVMDFIITVCDNAAGETCPVWAGRPAVAHWGVPDPAKNPAESKGFKDAWLTLRRRVELLLALPVEKLDHLAREQELRLIGKEV